MRPSTNTSSRSASRSIKGGHDYLREMCAPARYMVLEDVPSLPLELPKIYQRHVQAHLSASF